MLRSMSVWVKLILTTGLITSASYAQPFGNNPIVAEIPRAAQSPDIDGNRFTSPDEWTGALMLDCSPSRIVQDGEQYGWVNPEWESRISVNQLSDGPYDEPGEEGTDGDCSTSIYHMWDDNALYIFVEKRDNYRDIEQLPDADPNWWWERESVSLFIDLIYERQHSRWGDSAGLNVLNFMAAPQSFGPQTITWEYTNENRENFVTQDPADLAGLEYAYQDRGIDFGGEADQSYEIKIPWATLQKFNLPEAPALGTPMGFSWIVLDPDGEEEYGGQLQCWGHADYPFNYTTMVFSETAAIYDIPTVTRFMPVDGGMGYPDSPITAAFSEPMSSATLNTVNFLVSGSVSGDITGTVAYDAETQSVTFFPDTDFQVEEIVTVTISGDVVDEEGTGLDSNGNGQAEGAPADDFVRSFPVWEPLMMTAYAAAEPPTLDGQITDEEYAEAVPMYVEFSNLERIPGALWGWDPPRDSADMSFTAYALYTSDDLYIAVDVADDSFRDDSHEAWQDDGVEIYVDGDRVANDMGADWEHTNPEGFQITMDIGGQWSYYNPEFGQNWRAATRTYEERRTIEFRISLTSIDIEDGPGVAAPGPGDIIGLNIAINDDDDGGDLESQGVWSGNSEDVLWHRESDWGRLYFSPTPAPPLSVVSPNGSEGWAGGMIHEIRWVTDETITTDVKIEYSTDDGNSWTVEIASTPNTGTYEWTVPMEFSEETRVRISDAPAGNSFDISDIPFVIRAPISPIINHVWHHRGAVFPAEPVNIYARVFPGDMDVGTVQAQIYSDEAVLTSIALVDDGSFPDEEADDQVYSGQWLGTDQLGYYAIDLLTDDVNGNQSRRFHADGVSVAHTIISFPDRMLVSPENLPNTRIPLLIEDDGSGYLTEGFLSAEFDIHLGDEGLEPEILGMDFIGTGLEGANLSLETNESYWHDGRGNWWLDAALASAGLLHVIPGPGPSQAVFAYITVAITPNDYRNLWLNPEVRFDENDERTAKLCCSNLEMGRGDVDTSGTIESFDASLVLMHAVRKLDLNWGDDFQNNWAEEEYGFTFPRYTQHMADVSGQMGITALDAALILQHTTDMITHFPTEEGYYRLWDAPTEWWNPPTEAPLPPKLVASVLPRLHRTVSLGTLEERADGVVAVPVLIDELEGVLAGSFVLTYDPAQLQSVGVRSAELTQNYLFADHATDDRVRVGFAGAEWQQGSGALAEVLFRYRDVDSKEMGELFLSEVQLNEGNVETQVTSSPTLTASSLPQTFALYANYPNPFNPNTTIRYDLPGEGAVRLSVYNLSGQKIRTLLDGPQVAGVHRVAWDGKDETGIQVASGIYLYRLETEEGSLVRKMMLLK